MSQIPSTLAVSILGGGIAGLGSALALTKWLPLQPRITVYEVRTTPATIGGAVNLTPNALRYLDHLGVLDIIRQRKLGADVESIELYGLYDGAKHGEVDFKGSNGRGFGAKGFKALRILRGELLEALLEAIVKLDNITIAYGKKTTAISESENSVTVTFSDNTTVATDMLIGCDGIHSAVRTLFVEPSRLPVYSGIAVAFAFSPINLEQPGSVFFTDTSVVISRRGSFLSSFFDSSRENVYVGAVMETTHVASREGWKARGEDQEQVRRDIIDRFSGGALQGLTSLIERAGEWHLYPVFKLQPKGKWSSRRAMLLGDAAHAMPPQGESTGIALEDTIIFARVMSRYQETSIPDLFSQYERLRRPRVDAAYNEANFRWETVKDSAWLAYKLKSWITPWFLWWVASAREKSFEEDLAEIDLSAP